MRHHQSLILQKQAKTTIIILHSTMKNLMKPLPRLGLGMAALGRPGYINMDRDSVFGGSDSRSIDDMQTQANLVLDSLFRYGRSSGDGQNRQSWVDCARSYGLSEKFVGEYLRNNNIAPEDVYVSSKWGYCECRSNANYFFLDFLIEVLSQHSMLSR